MKKKGILFGFLALLIAFMLFLFRESIVDLLPIDQSGWKITGEGTLYLNEKGDPVHGWQDIDGARYFFHPDAGMMHTGWLNEGSHRFYLNANGNMHTGWLELDGNRYYLDAQGRLQQGALVLDGCQYYLNDAGIPQEGIFPVGEELQYFTVDGQCLTGWITIADRQYYLTEQAQLHRGWLTIGAQRYYLNEQDGAMATGWITTDAGSFYLLPDGILATGWTEIDGVTFCFDENGSPCSGWQERNGVRYYLKEDGTFYSGWLEDNGKRYYLLDDGTPAKGKLELDGETYFFSSTGMNFIMVNPWNPLPDDFSVELVECFGVRLDPECRDALEQMLADCRAAGHWTTVVSGYRSISDQVGNLQNKINSYMAEGYSYGDAYAISTRYIAVPGTSEHHLGLAVDIVDSTYPKLDYQQDNTAAQRWLMENCWQYGFILRYPYGSTEVTGIVYEPWHYRYVGVELAMELKELGVCLEVYIDWLTDDGTTCGGKLVSPG